MTLTPLAYKELKNLPAWVNKTRFLQAATGARCAVIPFRSKSKVQELHDSVLENSALVMAAIRKIKQVELSNANNTE